MSRRDEDRLTAALIAAITRRHARARALTGTEEAAALAELAEVAAGRADLLAEQAGLALGFHEHDSDSQVYLQVAQLCIKAGADTTLGAPLDLLAEAWPGSGPDVGARPG